MSVLHVVFCPSFAGSLREAVRLAGRRDRVVALFDDFSFGPINPPDPALRRAWEEDKLGYEPMELTAEDYAFWSMALEPDLSAVAWVSRRRTKEYAGFLEWLWRFGDADCSVIDATDASVRDTQPIVLAALRAEELLDYGLLEAAIPLDREGRQSYRSVWGRLREENSPLRIMRDSELTSAAIDHFDPLIMSFRPGTWSSSRGFGRWLTLACWRRVAISVKCAPAKCDYPG